MKKIILFILLSVFCASELYAQGIVDKLKSVIARKNVAAGGVVDYTADANCMGAWFMNGGLGANGVRH